MRVSGGQIVTKSPATAVRKYLGVKARDETTAVAGYLQWECQLEAPGETRAVAVCLMVGVPTRCSRGFKSCSRLADDGSAN